MQVLTFDEQVPDLARTLLCDMVCDGQCLGLRFSFWILLPCSKTPCALHLSACLECSQLLLSISVVSTAMLLCAAHQHCHWLQHEHGVRRERGVRWPNIQTTKPEVQSCGRRRLGASKRCRLWFNRCKWRSGKSQFENTRS